MQGNKITFVKFYGEKSSNILIFNIYWKTNFRKVIVLNPKDGTLPFDFPPFVLINKKVV